ncbi:formate hydrogenlyase family maturation protein [Campylobacter iguaniorum]|uniref:formate hydrogenlyase maturation HycH family protein n=1 Tax=Campylobacter iguaniorum TaxID=1244531 RepID=UPI00073A3187|nr:formate hydrogenlyase maturation HycH family protein [Campylobacter iguaniorum]ALV23754.1 formate hydrogenlyase family maturation protein [Campylobacter iguaniorum]
MIQVWKLTKRHVDQNNKLPYAYKQIVTFSTCIGHGVGTIDFNEKIAEFSDDEWDKILENSGKYAKFKLGNISRYFEVEILPDHAKKLLLELQDSKFKEILESLQEGYIVLKKGLK